MTTRRYFDRTPGVEGDVGETTRIINNYSVINEGADSAVLQDIIGRLSAVEQETDTDMGDPTVELFSNVSGVVTPSAHDRVSIDIASTAGDWTLNLSDLPQTYPATVHVKIDSSGAHTPTFPTTTVWEEGSAPSGTLWADGKRAVVRFTRIPLTDQFEGELLWSGDTPATDDTTVVSPPDLTFHYSLSGDRTSPVALSGATLPAAPVAILIGPLDAKIKHVDIWHGHSGTLPAVGSEDTVDSYVRRESIYPYDLLGDVAGVANLWDTTTDPTGNNRASYSQVIDARVTYIDDTTADYQVSFSTTTPSTSTYTATYGSDDVVSATPTLDITVPSAADRAVVVVALYRALYDMNTLSLGGNLMTVIQSNYNAAADTGMLIARIDEASMPAAGTRTLTPTFSASVGANTLVHYHYLVFEGAAGVSFEATIPSYSNSGTTVATALSIPSAATVMTVAGHQSLTSMSNDWDGTSETELQTDSAYDMTSQAEWKLDNGDAAAETVNWTTAATIKQACIVYASASDDAVDPPPPNTPGVPTLTTPTKPADNQLRTTWDATSNAVSYEGRIGTTNPPTTSVIALGDVLNWTRSGLAPSTLYYMQVRAVSSDGTRSAWSSVASGTTNASDVVTPPSGNDSFFHGETSDLISITHSKGTHRTDGVMVPNWHGHFNTGTWPQTVSACRVGSVMYNDALQAWSQNAGSRPASVTAMGQKSFVQIGLSHVGHPKRSPQPSNAELAILDMARSGSLGTDNRRADWRNIGANLAQWPGVVFVGVSHESNGSWYSNYSGVNPNLIGSSVLASVTNSQFGTALGAALRQVAVDGNCATVHRLALEGASTELRAGANSDSVVVVYTLTGSSDSRPPGDVPGDLTSAWQDIAHPDPEYFDVLGITYYGRGNGRPTRKSTGDVNSTSGWTFPNAGLQSTYHAKSQEWNRPIGFWEAGLNWDVFDWPPTFADGTTDDQGNVWWKKNAEDWPSMDLAFITYWHAGGDRAAGSTYQLPEANYGYQKTSGTNPRFPKTLAQLRSMY